MRPSITLGLAFAVAFGATTLGCRDSAPAQPQALDTREATGGDKSSTGADSSGTEQPASPTAPADPAPGSDTAITPPPPRPAAFTLEAVALGVQPGEDTTRTVRLAGVTARLYRVRAADGTAIPEALIGSVVANGNGEMVFRDLSSAHYRLDVQAPPGGPYADGVVSIAPPWSAQIRIAVVLHRKG
jgi:hypothetical protein